MLTQVKASAGSGKTWTLTNTFMQRLQRAGRRLNSADSADGADYAWTDILAVTFTNMAAAEMRARVVASLKERALGQGAGGPADCISPSEAAQWLSVLLRRFSRLNIRTIDSLLHQAVRLDSLALGLPPDFEPAFDLNGLADDLYSRVVQRAEAGDSDSLQLIRDICNAQTISRDGKALLPGDGLRSLVREVFQLRLAQPDTPLAQRAALEQRRAQLMDALRDAASRLQQHVLEEELKVNATLSKFIDKTLTLPQDGNFPHTKFLERESLDACLNKASKGMASPQAEAAFAALAQAMNDGLEQGALLRDAADLLPFAHAADAMLQELDDEQRRSGRAPSVRMERYAADLLSDEYGVSKALYRMGSRLAHMLIDEFQDTSRGQWKAMAPLAAEALSCGGSLFYVGDVKQAIYTWRGGDASLFDQVPLWPGVAEIAGEPRLRVLPCNWRSARDVVEFNNAFFSRLADPAMARSVASALLDSKKQSLAEPLALMLQTSYQDTEQEVPPKHADKHGLVCLYDIREPTKEDMQARVETWLRTLLVDELLQRRRPGEVAILVRTNTEAAMVSRWCADWTVPVVSANSLLLASHPLIRQCTALLRFVDYPLNDLALWEFISMRGLFPAEWALQRQPLLDWLVSRDAKQPMYKEFRAAYPDFWKRAIEPFFNRAGFMTPYDMIREILARFHTLENNTNDVIFLRRFLETAHAAESKSMSSLSSFLEFWDEKGAEERVPLSENMDAVTVMTIHKSKGLEFPVVVVPFHMGANGGRQELAWRITEDGAAPCKLAPALGHSYAERMLPLLMEHVNLLYVAWTRAEEELHAGVTRVGDRAKTPLAKALAVLLQGYGLEQNADIYTLGQAPPGKHAPPMNNPVLVPTLDGPDLDQNAYDPMDWLPRLRLFRSALGPTTFDARRRGELAHRCFEKLRWTGDPHRDAEAALAEAFRGFSEPHDPAGFALAPETVVEECRAMLHWFFKQDGVPELLTFARPELAIVDVDGGVRRADMVSETAEHRVVVEYKTGKPDPDHAVQVRRYMQLLRPMEEKPMRGLLVYLDERRLESVADAPGKEEDHA